MILETRQEGFLAFIDGVMRVLSERYPYGFDQFSYTRNQLFSIIETMYFYKDDKFEVKIERVDPCLYTDGPSGDGDILVKIFLTRYSKKRTKSTLATENVWFNIFLTSEDAEIVQGYYGTRDHRTVPVYFKSANAALKYILEWSPNETKYNSKKRQRLVREHIALPQIDEV